MSEFTYGNLITTKNQHFIRSFCRSGTAVLPLSDKWTAFFTNDDGEMGSPKYIENMSNQCPVLYFFNLEDHGWGYEIWNDGQMISSLEFHYELEDFLLYEMAYEMYPDIDRFSKEGEVVFEELESKFQDDLFFEQAVRKHFETVNMDAFHLFELDTTAMDGLREILRPETFLNREGDAVERFKQLLDIEDMSWIRFDRTENRDDIEFI